jgi:cytochrome c
MDFSMVLHVSKVKAFLFLICVLGCATANRAELQTTAPAKDGIYTKAQAERGKALYAKACASCHMLPGVTDKPTNPAAGPDLGGETFFKNWEGKPAGAVFNVILTTMPNDFSMELDGPKTADVLAFILQSNKFPEGAKDLTLESAQAATIRRPGL